MKNDVRVYFHRFLYIYLQYYLHAIKYSIIYCYIIYKRDIHLFTKSFYTLSLKKINLAPHWFRARKVVSVGVNFSLPEKYKKRY